MSKNYSGKLDIDVSGFNKALKEAKTNLALVASEFKLAKEQGSVFESLSDKLTRTLEALNRVYEQSNSKIEFLRKSLDIKANAINNQIFVVKD